jgi:hypothetical protein
MKFLAAAAALSAVLAIAAARPAKVTEKVFFDISIGGQPKGRIVMGLFGEYVRTASRAGSHLGSRRSFFCMF